MPNTNERDALIVGGKYNWKNQPERLVYLGHNWSGNGYWHQFALVNAPCTVWCEVLDEDLPCIEKTQPVALAATAPNAGAPLAETLAKHLRDAHAFVECTEAFGHAAASGTLECNGKTWNIDASKAALAAAPAQQAGAPLPLAPIEEYNRLIDESDAEAPLPSDVQALIEELDNAAGRLTQRTNNPLDGLLNAAARKLEELAGAPLPLAPAQDVTDDQIRSLWQTTDTGDVEDDILSFARALLALECERWLAATGWDKTTATPQQATLPASEAVAWIAEWKIGNAWKARFPARDSAAAATLDMESIKSPSRRVTALIRAQPQALPSSEAEGRA